MTKREKREFKARSALNLAMGELVAANMGWKDDKGYTWMMVANPNFGGATPVHLVMSGRAHKVLAFIESARYLNESPDTSERKDR